MAIKLGGGSTSQINEVVSLNNDADTVTLADGRVYLRGGIIETDSGVYPNAATTTGYTDTSFSISSQDTQASGLTWDGTHFWVCGGANDSVYKYTAAGVYTGTSFSTASQTASPFDIAWDGTSLWVLGSGQVFKYNAAGVYQSVSFTVSAQETNSTAITWDGTHFWVVGYTTDKAYKYTAAGAYTGTSFSVPVVPAVYGIEWDGTSFWVLNGSTPQNAYKYNSSGVYQGVSFSVAAQDIFPWGIAWDGTSFWVHGTTNEAVYKYGDVVGVTSATSFGAQNYVRVV